MFVYMLLLLLILVAYNVGYAQRGVPAHQQLPQLLQIPVAHEVRNLQGIKTRHRARGIINYDGGYSQPGAVTRYTGNSTNYVGEFNPILAGGTRGYPGIRIRVNMRTFQWASSIARQMIDRDLPRMQIPDVHETIREINGRVTVCNIHISKYRTPCNVAIYPSAPNHIIVNVDDLDIGVTGNLDGVAVLLLPINFGGIIIADLYHVSLTLSLSLGHGPTGAPCIIVDGCQVRIGYADVCINNGGLIGMLANMLFRQDISMRVKNMIPDRVCAEIPRIIAEKVNPKLQGIPQSVAFNDFAGLATNLLRSSVPAYCNSPACLNRKKSTETPMASRLNHEDNTTETNGNEEYSNPFEHLKDDKVGNTSRLLRFKYFKKLRGAAELAQQFHRKRRVSRQAHQPQSFTQHVVSTISYNGPRKSKPLIRQPKIVQKPRMISVPAPQKVIQPVAHKIISKKTIVHARIPRGNRTTRARSHGTAVATVYENQYAPTAQGLGADPCAGCPSDDGMSAIKDLLLGSLDLRKLADLVLGIQVMNAYASNFDYTVDLTGEFSPGGVGGTPFGPYPMMFPPTGPRMIDILISDFTINSLLYHMHKKGFLAFLVNSQTPKIGDLLRTTCGEGNDEEDLTSAETDTSEEKRRKQLQRLKRLLKRNRRQTTGGKDDLGINDLGICLGDIMPELREKYPNKTLTLLIHTARAPSLVISGRNGGMVTLDVILLIDILVDGTNERAGTLTATLVMDIGLKFMGTRISAIMSLREAKLQDKEGTLGLPQDALDNLSNIGKEMMVKGINDQFSHGTSISIPMSNLPIRLINPDVMLVEHGILISADFDASPTLFSGFLRRRRR